ncbi:protein huluwa-like [Dermochelys coriacea]|uniref:protein huluwa-like n=1 Tax=Dermochelys coriacea TaxID=27794 RepID=UPI001CAA276A|nr:protein huluwa-like [Dermochelys coriacea]
MYVGAELYLASHPLLLQVTPKRTFPQRCTSTLRTARTTFPTPVGSVHFEYSSSIWQGDDGTAPLNSANFTASLGPGMDSDFGASAGISLRVVSSDSEEGAGEAGGCSRASYLQQTVLAVAVCRAWMLDRASGMAAWPHHQVVSRLHEALAWRLEDLGFTV